MLRYLDHSCQVALNSALYQEIGLPTPQWSAMEVCDAFIDANPDMWFSSNSGPVRPKAGLHFASSIVGAENQTVFEVLPGTWYERIQNRDAILGALVADVWSDHVDSRQALFLQRGGEHALSMVFIDHGHMFGGPDCAQRMRLRACFHLDMRMYAGLDLADRLDSWIQRIQDGGMAMLANAASSIPEEWQSSSLQENVDRLKTNLPKLRGMLIPAVYRWIFQEIQKSRCIEYKKSLIVA